MPELNIPCTPASYADALDYLVCQDLFPSEDSGSTEKSSPKRLSELDIPCTPVSYEDAVEYLTGEGLLGLPRSDSESIKESGRKKTFPQTSGSILEATQRNPANEALSEIIAPANPSSTPTFSAIIDSGKLRDWLPGKLSITTKDTASDTTRTTPVAATPAVRPWSLLDMPQEVLFEIAEYLGIEPYWERTTFTADHPMVDESRHKSSKVDTSHLVVRMRKWTQAIAPAHNRRPPSIRTLASYQDTEALGGLDELQRLPAPNQSNLNHYQRARPIGRLLRPERRLWSKDKMGENASKDKATISDLKAPVSDAPNGDGCAINEEVDDGVLETVNEDVANELNEHNVNKGIEDGGEKSVNESSRGISSCSTRMCPTNSNVTNTESSGSSDDFSSSSSTDISRISFFSSVSGSSSSSGGASNSDEGMNSSSSTNSDEGVTSEDDSDDTSKDASKTVYKSLRWCAQSYKHGGQVANVKSSYATAKPGLAVTRGSFVFDGSIGRITTGQGYQKLKTSREESDVKDSPENNLQGSERGEMKQEERSCEPGSKSNPFRIHSVLVNRVFVSCDIRNCLYTTVIYRCDLFSLSCTNKFFWNTLWASPLLARRFQDGYSRHAKKMIDHERVAISHGGASLENAALPVAQNVPAELPPEHSQHNGEHIGPAVQHRLQHPAVLPARPAEEIPAAAEANVADAIGENVPMERVSRRRRNAVVAITTNGPTNVKYAPGEDSIPNTLNTILCQGARLLNTGEKILSAKDLSAAIAMDREMIFERASGRARRQELQSALRSRFPRTTHTIPPIMTTREIKLAKRRRKLRTTQLLKDLNRTVTFHANTNYVNQCIQDGTVDNLLDRMMD